MLGLQNPKYEKPDTWPHSFAPKGGEYPGINGRMWKDMICNHCYKVYIYGRDPRPTEPCPKRTDMGERGRMSKGFFI